MPEYYVKVETIGAPVPDGDGEVFIGYRSAEDLIPAEYVTVDIPVDEALVEALAVDLLDQDTSVFDIAAAHALARVMVKAGWSKPL